MSLEDDDLDRRGFTAEALLETAKQALGSGVEARLPPGDRFLVNAARTVRRRLDAGGLDDAPAVFVYCESDKRPLEADIDEPLLHHGHRPLGSRIWFLSEIATAAKGVHLEPWNDADAFQQVTALGYGRQPALVFNPVTGVMEGYPEGLGNETTAYMVHLDDVVPTLEAIFDTIEIAHHDLLAAPQMPPVALRLWTLAGKYHVADKAEDRVQAMLYITLMRVHPNCDVRFEQPGKTGRVDLEVYGRDQGGTGQLALLELKVLRSCGSGGASVSTAEVDAHIKDSVEQAASYGKERGFPNRVLCCFDMRKTHTGASCFEHVLELAREHDVRLRVWPIFNAINKCRGRLLAGELFGESPAAA